MQPRLVSALTGLARTRSTIQVGALVRVNPTTDARFAMAVGAGERSANE